MNKEEKQLLKTLVDCSEGMLSSDSFTYGSNRKIAQSLVAKKLVEEFYYKNISSYRPTEKGIVVFQPLYKKIWFWIKGDVKTVIVSVVTSIITAYITLSLTK